MKSDFSSKDLRKLSLLLIEARNRGIELDVSQIVTGKSKMSSIPFPVDRNGYFTRRDGRYYNANESQKAFIDSKARFCAFVGSRGSGKTAAGAQKALRKVAQGLSGVIINPDFENFKVSTWPEFREWIPWSRVVPAHRYRAAPSWQPLQPFILSFDNGANIICKGLKDPDSARGPNVNWLWYDEAQRDKIGEPWQIAVASVRIGPSPQAWITATSRKKIPGGGEHWIYRFFIRQDIPQDAVEALPQIEENVPLVEYFLGTMEENKDNLDPGYYASMLAAYPSGYLREQEIFGRFVDPEGVLGNPAWFDGKIVESPPDTVKMRIRYWDLAASEKKIAGKKINDPDESVGTLLSWDGDLKFCIENQVHGRWEWGDLKNKIAETARLDGPYVPVYIEQEPAAGGKNQVEEIKIFIRDNVGAQWKVEGHRPTGDKVVRANMWFAEASQGRFTMVKGEWNREFLDQLSGFPEALHDDHVDSVSGARQVIAPIRTWRHISFLAV